MKKSGFVTLVVAVGLLIVAFSPPVMDLAEQSDNVHFGQHVLILLAGLMVAYAFQSLGGHRLFVDAGLARRGLGLAGLGMVLFLATQVPAVDVVADQSIPIHMFVHLVTLAAGGLIGIGFLSLASEPSKGLPAR